MASVRPHHPRRRSRSASYSSPILRRSPDNSLRIATKRTHPIQTISPMSQGSTPLSWDTDAWRRGKRRRRDTSSADVTMDSAQDQGRHDIHCPVIPPGSTFPALSADFNIFPRSDRPSRRCASYSSPLRLDGHLNTPSHIELTRLRSNAFWELHRSVAESGEGFIQRMRDYERVRSRQVFDPTRSAHKRSFVFQATRTFSCMRDSDVSDDDDDVQILAGKSPGDLFPRSTYHSKRLDAPTHSRRPPEVVYAEGIRFTHSSASNQSLTPTCCSGGEGFSMSTNTDSPGSSSVSIPSTIPSSPSSPVDPQFLDVDVCSILTLPSSFLPFPSHNEPPVASSSEKAVAELTLALANGAGSLTDYSLLQNNTGLQQDGGEPGELWS